MGFAGTVSDADTAAAGLTEMAGGAFDGGPPNPMLPGSWSPDDPPGGGQRS